MKGDSKFLMLELSASEIIILKTHLTEFLKGSQSRVQRLIRKRFELIETVLFAKFGFKYSESLGLQRMQSYLVKNHLLLVKEMLEIDVRIARMDYSNGFLDEINKRLNNHDEDGDRFSYEFSYDYNESEWRKLVNKYLKLNAVEKETELQEIISALSQLAEKI